MKYVNLLVYCKCQRHHKTSKSVRNLQKQRAVRINTYINSYAANMHKYGQSKTIPAPSVPTLISRIGTVEYKLRVLTPSGLSEISRLVTNLAAPPKNRQQQ